MRVGGSPVTKPEKNLGCVVYKIDYSALAAKSRRVV